MTTLESIRRDDVTTAAQVSSAEDSTARTVKERRGALMAPRRRKTWVTDNRERKNMQVVEVQPEKFGSVWDSDVGPETRIVFGELGVLEVTFQQT